MARVLVIGPRPEIGRAIVAALSESGAVEACEQAGLRQESLQTVFTRIESGAIDTIVYSPSMAQSRSLSPDLAEAERIISHLAAKQIRRVVLLSSALIYGSSPHNQGLISESRVPVCLTRSRLAHAWMDLESLAARRLTAQQLMILRPATVLDPDGADYLSRLLRGPLSIVLSGHDPSLQFLSPDDLA